MINELSFFLEAETAKKRLAQLFESELGRVTRLSTATTAVISGRTARTSTEQNDNTFAGHPHDRHEERRPFMNPLARRWLFIMPGDWTWWVWLVTACLLLTGLMGMAEAFLAALLLSIAQSVSFLARERAFKAFSVQLRLAYTLLLIICFFPPIRWLYWLPALGTFALVIFGYCLMARLLSFLPWNRTEPVTGNLLRRTFLSRPRLLDRANNVSSAGCGARLCSIEAQVEPETDHARTNSRRYILT
jgi:hypothetical protein